MEMHRVGDCWHRYLPAVRAAYGARDPIRDVADRDVTAPVSTEAKLVELSALAKKFGK